MIMIYYWDKKLKKRLHVLEADIITIKKKKQRKNIDLMSLGQKDVFFMGCVPNDCHGTYLSNKSLSY